jgi:hypothetical protein
MITETEILAGMAKSIKVLNAFNPDEARDGHGKWTAGRKRRLRTPFKKGRHGMVIS